MPRLTVAYDYICPWCWVAWRQAKQLKEEFPTLEFEWKGFELLPEGLPYVATPPDPDAGKKPPTPSRLDFLLMLEGLTLPKRTRSYSISRKAMEGAEFAADQGKEDAYHEAVYHAYWEENKDIADMEVLRDAARQAGLDADEFQEAIDERAYKDRIVEFDDPAHEAGIWNVPTWMFPDGWIAEQPTNVLRERVRKMLETE